MNEKHISSLGMKREGRTEQRIGLCKILSQSNLKLFDSYPLFSFLIYKLLKLKGTLLFDTILKTCIFGKTCRTQGYPKQLKANRLSLRSRVFS